MGPYLKSLTSTEGEEVAVENQIMKLSQVCVV